MMRRVIISAALLAASAEGTPGGTCGYECKGDSDCSGCGSAGVCSYPHGKDATFLATMTACVSAPSQGVPKDPPITADDSVWPDQWSADLQAWTYSGWESDATESIGKFYYDKRYGSKSTYTKLKGQPSSAVEVWNAKVDGIDKMFMNTGKLCIGFKITDPGIKTNNNVGIETPDWIKRCVEAGFGKFVGRELVTVNGKEEWADHYSCRVLYDKGPDAVVNQSIVFQNWHSLGLGGVPKGLPLRVTAGNSKPDPQKTPRMNTVFHTNFKVGESSSTQADFQWNPWCVGPLCFKCPTASEEEVSEFFGHEVSKEHLASADFISRGRFLPLAKANPRDLTRAAQRKPRQSFQGATFQEAMQKLNVVLARETNLTTKRCDDFSVRELHDIQQVLFDARTPQLNHIYKKAGDTRLIAHGNNVELQSEQAWRAELTAEYSQMAQAGLCHELVMWFVHHLSAPAREEVKKLVVLPLLPEVQHTSDGVHKAHQTYNAQISCAICHVAPASDSVIV